MPLPDYVRAAMGDQSLEPPGPPVGLPDYVKAAMPQFIQPELTEAERREKAGLVPVEQEQFAIKHPTLYAGREAIRETGETVAEAARGVGKFLGLEKAVDPLARTAARATVPEELKEAIPEASWSEIGGGSLQIGSMLIPYGTIAKLGIKGLKYGVPILPEAAAKITSLMATGALGGYTYEAGEKIQRGEAPTPGITTAISAVAPIAIPAIIKQILPKHIDGAVKKTIKEGIKKGVRPYVSTKGQTAAQRTAYYEKAQDAVESIIDNKAILQFTDDAGKTIKGQLPKSLEQFQDSIHQTKTAIFEQYDALAKQAGQRGAQVNLKSIADDLVEIADDNVLKTERPEVIKYVQDKMKRYIDKDTYTAIEAQKAITALNDNLQSFYKNPSYDTASKAYVDSLIVNRLRKSLDNVIEETTDAGYQALKNKYGALKSIERDVSRRAVTDARKNVKGLVENLSDVSTGAMAVHGLLSMNPQTIAAAATAKGLTAWRKRLLDPNRTISKMFSTSGRLIEKGIKQAEKKAFRPPRFPGDIAAKGIGKGIKKIRSRFQHKIEAIQTADDIKKIFSAKYVEELKALPPGQGFELVNRFEALKRAGKILPEWEGELQKLLPPGQGFTLPVKTIRRPVTGARATSAGELTYQRGTKPAYPAKGGGYTVDIKGKQIPVKPRRLLGKEYSFQQDIYDRLPELDRDDITYIANQIADDFQEKAMKLSGKKGYSMESVANAWRRFAKTGKELGPRGGVKSFDFGIDDFEKKAREYIELKRKTP